MSMTWRAICQGPTREEHTGASRQRRVVGGCARGGRQRGDALTRLRLRVVPGRAFPPCYGMTLYSVHEGIDCV